jgi:hypothetical protein
MSQYRTLNECLFDAFANEDWCNPQEVRYLWAINEGVLRLNPLLWSAPQARKEHECVRGHTIKTGDTYYKHLIGGGWGNDWKFCAGCMAMILYFMHVDKLPPEVYTHWDTTKQEPVTRD